ncbi:ABC transporter ATP-binding protein [Treponema sp. OMZ 305]|uniref:ABC transporter ATP-binding protein n=1 Tax=Treponema sp. OMZ 305 TaxID=1659192 RepID=UPI0020A4F068|nr:ABC transporter ATP-binding protein [Treponema sp. OMZ 305]UTC57127.1 ABC transporter ATP-binding protein [Treponema sp. OMZ 305]
MELTLKHVTCGYGTTPILKDVSLTLRQGEIVCILGPNGIGKTTVFRSVLGFLKLLEGEVLLDGVPRDRIRARDFAKCVGYVPQSHEPPFPYSVPDVVVMGRAAHLRPFEAPGLEEYRIVDQVLNMLEISYLREKTYTRISGGERQMVLIARALAQNSGLLVMDEPTANLDFGNQIHVLQSIKKLTASGLGVLMTTHNPDHAFLCCDRVILLTKDKQVLEGTVDEIVTEENLRKAYGVEVRITTTVTETGEKIRSCVPLL